jgi:nucleotide-binding universal stress UspA family protein
MQYLVAVDGSEPSIEALEYAIDLATRADASLLVAYAVEPRVLVEGTDEEAPTNAEVGQRIYTEDLEVAEERGEEVLDDARERAERADVRVETTLVYGDPVDSIDELAIDEAVDGIVVGHRGLSDRVEGMVGSVAKGLVEHATVPVTVVKGYEG